MQAIYINYNIFHTLLISLASLLVGWRLLRKRNNYLALFFGGVWWAVFTTYLLVALMDYNYHLDFQLNARYILGIMQMFVAVIGFFIFAFLILTITGNLTTTKKIIYYFIAPLMLAVGLILALTKWQGPFISAWGVKYLPHHLAQLFFNTVFTIIFILLIYSFWRLIARRRQVQSSRSLILVHLSLFIFLITGFIDELGLAIGWTMSLFRLMMLAAILLAYFCWPKRVVT